MKVTCDPMLAEALRREVNAPPFDDAFADELWRRIDGEDGRRPAPPSPVLARLRRVRPRRRYLLVTAAAAAAVVVAAALSGVPGLRETQPAPATAAMREVAAIDAGLARVKTFQGTIVFDGTPTQRSLFGALDDAVAPLRTARFVLCANGDSYLDVRYAPVTAAEVARMRHQYGLKLAYWRRVLPAHPKGLTSAQIALQRAQRRDDLLRERSVTERCVFATDETAHRIQIKQYKYDVFSGRFLGIRYKAWRGFAGVRDLAGAEIGVVLSLPTQVRSALADQDPGIAVSDTTYEGRPAQLVVMRLDGGVVWRALVDRDYGVVLSLGPETASAAGASRFVAFHIVGASMNAPVSATSFELRPDYRYTPDGTAPARGAPDVALYNFGPSDISYVVPSELGRRAEPHALAPAWLPGGYRLAEVGVSPTEGPGWTDLIYRRGLSTFSVESAAGSDAPFGVFDWTQVQGPVLQLHGGALSGWPAETATLGFVHLAASDPPVLSAWGDWGEGLQVEFWGRSVVVAGDLSHGELLRVGGSLRPVSGRSPLAPGRLAALVALAALLAVAAPTAVVSIIRRPVGPKRRLLVALAGCLGVAAGLALDWHSMSGAGSHFATSGWSETPGLVALDCALGALCAAAWLPLAALPPVRQVLAGLVAPLAALALVAVGAAVVYLPASARFTTEDPAGLSLVQRYVLGRSSTPSPALGMLVSAVGAGLLLASALTLRRPEPATPAARLGGRAGRDASLAP